MPLAYCGRFAPSPTGPLHFGSLIAAVGSYLDARHHGGRWLVRIEDLDPPREVPGAANAILHTLEAFGLHWDGPVAWQSKRADAYEQATQQLLSSGWAYPCGCSRRDVMEIAGGGVYPGTCRGGIARGRHARTLRMLVAGASVSFHDRIQGPVSQDLESQVGDFVIRRADGLFAYQLAVVVDDAAQGVTHVVRGSDLVDSTPRQVHLQRVLGLPVPQFAHLPVALDVNGRKLAKQTSAAAVGADPSAELARALAFLGQAPVAELAGAPPGELLRWASACWDIGAVPRSAGPQVIADG